MSATVLLHDPRPVHLEATEAIVQAGNALTGLAGKVVGFIDNSKPNFNHLLDDLAEILTTRYGVKSVLTRRKPITTVPAGDEAIAELVRDCDLVITGSGD